MDVPFLDLPQQSAQLKDEILPLWEEIYDTAGYIGGKHVSSFEDEFGVACDTEHCVSASSGTDALYLIFKALELRPEDEVIVPANSFIATAEAVSAAGAKVVFVDVLPDTYNMDPEALERAITPNTRGIVPVHLYGLAADMDPILALAEDRGLWVVEDAAQAHLAEYKGRKCGSMGLAAAFSFYPGKNLGACGDAGAVTTNDAALAHRIRILRDHGSEQKYVHIVEGVNARCDALQAAALRMKLRHLPGWNERRRAHAEGYRARLHNAPGIVLPHVPDHCLPVWHLYVIQVDGRDRVQALLKDNGVATGLHYPKPLHLQEAYAHLGYRQGDFPVSEACAERLLSLPMFPELRSDQIQHVADSVLAVLESAVVAQ